MFLAIAKAAIVRYNVGIWQYLGLAKPREKRLGGERMERLINGIRGFAERDWTIAEKVLVLSSSFLLGTVWGFWMSPVKHGVSIGSYNGNAMNRGPEHKEPRHEGPKHKRPGHEGPEH